MREASSASAPLTAIAFMMLSASLIAATTLLAKALGTPALGPALHPLQVTFGRFSFAFCAILACAILVRPKLQKARWSLHVLRTSLGALGVTAMFAAVAMIPLSDATAISFLNPVFALLFAIVFLGERVGQWRWIAVGLAFIGAVVLLRPGAGLIELGALLALSAAAVMGLEITVIKKLTGLEPAFQILLINNALGLCLISVPAFWVWQAPTPAQWAALGGLGITMAAAQACFVQAMSRADASFVAPFSYATLLFAALYDGTVFGAWPDGVSALGAGIIVFGAVLLAWREAKQQRGLVAPPSDT